MKAERLQKWRSANHLELKDSKMSSFVPLKTPPLDFTAIEDDINDSTTLFVRLPNDDEFFLSNEGMPERDKFKPDSNNTQADKDKTSFEITEIE